MSKHRLPIRWLLGFPKWQSPIRLPLRWTPGIFARWRMWRRRWTTCLACQRRINSLLSYSGMEGSWCDQDCYEKWEHKHEAMEATPS